MTQRKLKPCPFCGSKAVIKYYNGKRIRIDGCDNEQVITHRGWYGIGCVNPQCILFHDTDNHRARLMFIPKGKEEAITKWNERVSDR